MILALVACNSIEIDNQPVNNDIDNGEGITITARLAPLSSPTKAVQDPGNGTIKATWQEGEHIAILYEANSQHEMADAVITDVDAGGTATISFTVVSGTTDNTPCTLVYPYTAARADGSGVKDYSALFSAQDGLLGPDLDVRDGAGTIQVSHPDLTVTVQPAPLYATSFTIRNAANKVITTVSLSQAASSLFVALPAAASGTVYKFVANDDSKTYSKIQRLTKDIQAGYCYTTTLNMAAAYIDDLTDRFSQDYDEYVVFDGEILTGTLNKKVKIVINNGAAVTLAGVTINGTDDHRCLHAGITCRGDVTLILKDGTENIVKGFDSEFPGISVPSGSTLTIQGENAGTGKLVVSSNGYAAGIGGIPSHVCGNIVIEGGTIEATGGSGCAGIGGNRGYKCSDITISGGTVNATGGDNGAGIGSGYAYSGSDAGCGAITISGGKVKANGGSDGAGIGTGYAYGASYTCGDITISGGIVTATGGGNSASAGIGTSGTDNGGSNICGAITISGGAVEATGKGAAAGIGSGYNRSGTNSCGDITITNSVSSVTVTKGFGVNLYCIGEGYDSTCGTVTIAGEVTGSVAPASGSTYTFLPIVAGTLVKGRFSVSSEKQVYFSQGNLQATYNGTAWSWAFAEHQWDYIGGKTDKGVGEPTGNNFINGNGTVSAPGTIDLFGWVGSSSKVLTGYPAKYGISNSTNKWDDVYGDAIHGDKLISDWGTLAITNGGNNGTVGWRTLSAMEWTWMLGPENPNPGSNCRTSSTVNGTANARYTQATINTDGTPVKGLIIFPDNYEGGTPANVTWGPINTGSNYLTECTTDGWNALENAGCVFLPAAGRRWGSDIEAVTTGHYWTSSSDSGGYSVEMEFGPSQIQVYVSICLRLCGHSVRVVRNAN